MFCSVSLCFSNIRTRALAYYQLAEHGPYCFIKLPLRKYHSSNNVISIHCVDEGKHLAYSENIFTHRIEFHRTNFAKLNMQLLLQKLAKQKGERFVFFLLCSNTFVNKIYTLPNGVKHFASSRVRLQTLINAPLQWNDECGKWQIIN
jgi:hypothetical protein